MQSKAQILYSTNQYHEKLKKQSLNAIKPMAAPLRKTKSNICVVPPVTEKKIINGVLMICTGEACKIMRRRKKSSIV